MRKSDAKRSAPLLLVACLALGALAAQAQPGKLARRYNHDFSATLYPQSTPNETVESIVKALDAGRTDYLLAHLADPSFVDPRIAEYKAFYKGSDEGRALFAFERLVRETTLHFREDPALVKELRLFAKDADWDAKEDQAVGTLKKGSPRRVFLRKLEDRWFLENRQQ
jgi:hypothetical protein